MSIVSCKNNVPETAKDLTIFFVNDTHGQLDNFSKIKYIIDEERQETNVIVVSAGDMFSGNPIVDIYSPKGYPMIDVMNAVGFDLMAIGNHEFDYGEDVFQDRKEQSNFPWLCANINTDNSVISTPPEYTTISIDDLKITFLGLLETNGSPDDIIPATHPSKIENISFERPEDVVSSYVNLKEQEDADLYIALTHLGIFDYNDWFDDFSLANQFPYFDLIIAGHTNQILDTVVNNIPIVEAGKYLNYLGRTRLTIKNKLIETIHTEHIDLNEYQEYDADLKTKIDAYNISLPFLDDVVGYSHLNHHKYAIGCFYTDAFREYLNVDFAIQNSGGVRATLDEGDITKREIYAISPFNNGTLIYNMSVAEIKTFISETESGNYYSGIQIEKVDNTLIIKDAEGNILDDATILTVGINDYIPTVYSSYFPENGVVQSLTAAETLIAYLETINNQVNYPVCDCYFRFQ